MAMRETVSSMRVYLIVSGIVGSLASIHSMGAGRGRVAAIAGLLGAAFSLVYLYIGVRLRSLLATAPNQVFLFFKAAATLTIVDLLFSIAAGAALAGLFAFGIGLLATWYLYVNAKRLVNTAHGDAEQGVAFTQ